MTDYIKKFGEEGRRRAETQQEEAKVVRQIRANSHSLMQELEKRVQRDVDQANKEIYNSAKVFEVRRDFGMYSDEKTNDFVAMTADYPAATMYVLLKPSERILTRKLVTKKDSDADYLEEMLSEIEVSLDGDGNTVFLDPQWSPLMILNLYDKIEEAPGFISSDEVARLIVEPVVIAHTGIQTSTRPQERLANAVPAAASRGQAASMKSKAPTFSFVADSRVAEILERDYEELRGLDPHKATKSALVLSGGIIEGLLFDALVLNGNYSFEEACNVYLKNMIHPALKEKIIMQDRLTNVLRLYRNLIHPAREIKDEVTFTASDAKLAINAVDIIIREVQEWHSGRASARPKAGGGEASSG